MALTWNICNKVCVRWIYMKLRFRKSFVLNSYDSSVTGSIFMWKEIILCCITFMSMVKCSDIPSKCYFDIIRIKLVIWNMWEHVPKLPTTQIHLQIIKWLWNRKKNSIGNQIKKNLVSTYQKYKDISASKVQVKIDEWKEKWCTWPVTNHL